jgi:hypothetical protein
VSEPEQSPPPGHDAAGHPQVEAALEALAALDDLPVAEHAEVFQAAHDRLRAALTDAHDVPA